MKFELNNKISQDKWGKQVNSYSIQFNYDNRNIEVFICKICIGVVFHEFKNSNIFPYDHVKKIVVINSEDIKMSEEDSNNFFELVWETLRGDVII